MGKRRANGEGTVRQRKDGTWEGRALVGYGDFGKPTYKSVYGRTQAAVLAKKKQLESDVSAGLVANAGRETLFDYLAGWLKVIEGSVREGTHSNYESLARVHVTPVLGGVTLAKVTPKHVESLYVSMRLKGASPRVCQHTHAMLHRALKQAMKQGIIARNPCDVVDRPVVLPKAMKVLDAAQSRRLLDVAKDDPLDALYAVALGGGLRQGELLGLQWEDIDWDLGSVSVQRQVQYRCRKVSVGPPKTDAGRRCVELPAFAMAALREHRKRTMSEGRIAQWVFCDDAGEPLLKHFLVRRSFWPLLAKAGLARIRFHDLRHTAFALMIKAGVHMKAIQERAGHSSIAVTMDLYGHLLPGVQLEAAKKLDAMLFPATRPPRKARHSGISSP